ncbi:hypothetical protein ACHQM5_009865 [Ranunculus cassubicifolius]
MMLIWNCRGMVSSLTVQSLKGLIRVHCPDVICLMESKAKEKRVERVRKLIKYGGYYMIPTTGRSGGLVLFRKEGIDLEILAGDNNIITGTEIKPWQEWYNRKQVGTQLQQVEELMPDQQKKQSLELLKLLWK